MRKASLAFEIEPKRHAIGAAARHDEGAQPDRSHSITPLGQFGGEARCGFCHDDLAAGVFNDLLLLNPADIYRLFNLSSVAKVSLFSGMAGLAEQAQFGRATLLAALAAWTVVPLALAAVLFRRKQL